MPQLYLLLIVLILFLLYTLYIYRKGYKAGEKKTQKAWMSLMKSKVDDDGIESFTDWIGEKEE